MTTIFSKAPLRIGLAGGGTDVSPYCDLYGGVVVNAAISLYTHTSILKSEQPTITFDATDRNEKHVFPLAESYPIDGNLDLHKGVYNRLRKDFNPPMFGFHLMTFSDAPAGSGLGTSSTLVVAIIGAFNELWQLQLSKEQIAQYAFDIERNDLHFSGGRQDQYAATYGGFNYLEFENGEIKVNPLQIADSFKQSMEQNLVLYFTDTSRNSAAIIDEQVKNVIEHNEKSIDAMHHLKEQAILMKDLLENDQPDDLGPLLHFGFNHKKNMAANITNPRIDAIYSAALLAGASGGKISGAGGGGFMVFYCPDNTKDAVCNTLLSFGGKIRPYTFVDKGLESWSKSFD